MPAPSQTRLVTGVVAGGIAAVIALISPFVMQKEGHEARPYKDQVGVLTVCYGHTGRDIRVKTYTDDECRQLLNEDLSTASTGVLLVSPKLADKPYILGAATSFAYNVGIRTYAKSSVAKDFNAGKYSEGCTDMLKYTYAGGKYNKGLFNRRTEEYKICMKGVI